MILQTTADSRSACRESGKKNEATDPSHPQSLNDLKDFKDLRELRALKDLKGFRDLKDLRDLKDFREFRELRDFRERANAEWGPEGRKLRGGEGEAEKKYRGRGKYVDRGEICWEGAETAILFREIYC